MSIVSDMRRMDLEKRFKEETKSGAVKYSWRRVNSIYVAIYESDNYKTVNDVKYSSNTHVAFTFHKEIDRDDYRLADTKRGLSYDILTVKSSREMLSMKLKVVDIDGRK